MGKTVPRIVVTIKKGDDEEFIEECIEGVMRRRKIRAHGKVVFEGGTLDVPVVVVAEKVHFKPAFDDYTKRVLVRKSMFRMARYKRQSVSMLRRALQTEARIYRSGERTYTVLMLLNAAESAFADYTTLNVVGTELRVCSWGQVHGIPEEEIRRFRDEWRHFEIGDGMSTILLRTGRDILLKYREFTPLLCEINACSPREAVAGAGAAFDMFRALLNMPRVYGKIYRQYGGRPRPLATFLPSPVFGIFCDARFQEMYVTVNRYKYSREKITPERVGQAVEQLSRIAPSDKRGQYTREILLDILRRYGRGLDTPDWQAAFLLFWQALEVATLQDENNVNMDTVVKRVHNLIVGRKDDRRLKELLHCLRRTRNELVHLGEFDEEGQAQVDLLRQVVDRVIGSLFAKLDQLPERAHLEAYFRYVTEGDATLGAHRGAIEFISSERN